MAQLKNLIVEGDTRLIGDVNAGKITATSFVKSGGTASQFLKADGTVDSNAYSTTDTKNTAGSTNSTSKLFLIGATSQAANPQTYSRSTAYVGTDGYLYSNNKKTLNEDDKTYTIYINANDTVGGWFGKPAGRNLINDLKNGTCAGLRYIEMTEEEEEEYTYMKFFHFMYYTDIPQEAGNGGIHFCYTDISEWNQNKSIVERIEIIPCPDASTNGLVCRHDELTSYSGTYQLLWADCECEECEECCEECECDEECCEECCDECCEECEEEEPICEECDE